MDTPMKCKGEHPGVCLDRVESKGVAIMARKVATVDEAVEEGLVIALFAEKADGSMGTIEYGAKLSYQAALGLAGALLKALPMVVPLDGAEKAYLAKWEEPLHIDAERSDGLNVL